MLTPRENFIRFFKNQPCEWTPNSRDCLPFAPEEIIENVCRGLVIQQEPFSGESYGGKGFFGVEWVYEPINGGSMEVAPLFDDIEEWEDYVRFPDLDAIDWEGCAERNKAYLNTDKLIRTTFYTGFFERLISFVGFENASIALIDEDQAEQVHILFDRLADFHIELFKRMHKHFGVELLELHDDWGTQRSPMFSAETHKEMIVPYVRKVAEAVHAEGCFMEMHSCGKIDDLIPNLIETGVDTWRGQFGLVDKKGLVDSYGERFKFGVELRPAPGADSAELARMAKEYKENYRGKNVWLALSMRMSKEATAFLLEEIYG